MSAASDRQDDARHRAVDNRLSKLEAEMHENAKFRQRVQGAVLFVVGVVSLAAGAVSIAKFLQGFL